MTEPLINSSFSQLSPGLQLAVDSTSLGSFKTCPRKYYYEIVQGWQPRQPSVHLQFGIWFHEGCELYDRAKAEGQGHEEALYTALRSILVKTWNKQLNRPWTSDHPVKNRLTLIRTLVWYLDEFGPNDSLQTIILDNGRPAVELSFRVPLGIKTPDGEDYLLCGHLDRLAMLGGDPYLVDKKTTGGTLGAHFFAEFSPNNQMATYDVAGQIAYSVEIKGIIIDAVEVKAGFSRFQRHPIPRHASQREEWWSELPWWLGQMAQCAQVQVWPMNDKSCGQYGGCPFRQVCAKPPASREIWLRAEYVKRIWDPLVVRGDV